MRDTVNYTWDSHNYTELTYGCKGTFFLYFKKATGFFQNNNLILHILHAIDMVGKISFPSCFHALKMDKSVLRTRKVDL